MPRPNRAHQRAIRALMAETGLTYTRAMRELARRRDAETTGETVGPETTDATPAEAPA